MRWPNLISPSHRHAHSESIVGEWSAARNQESFDWNSLGSVKAIGHWPTAPDSNAFSIGHVGIHMW